jgi:sugar/nucleoside kinase (ribokinase family)
MKVIAVGSIALDTIKTPFGEVKDVLGGSASYFSISASYFTSVGIIGVVGRDFPQEFIDLFKKMGIETSGIKFEEGRTFRWAGEYGYDLGNPKTLDLQLNVFEKFEPEISDEMRDVEILFLAAIHPELQMKVMKEINAKLILSDTRDHWIKGERNRLLDVLKKTNGLLINEEEARMLSQEYNILKAARAIMKMGPQFLVIKRGEYGAVLFYKDRIFYVPAYPLEVVFDPTGAGDSFAGGFAGFLAHTGDYSFDNLKKAVVYGSAMGSFAVEKFSIEGLVDLNEGEIFERAKKFREFVEFEL